MKNRYFLAIPLLIVGISMLFSFRNSAEQSTASAVTLYFTDMDDCRCYFESEVIIHKHCDPVLCPVNCQHHMRKEVLSQERKMCKEGLFWDPTKLKGVKPEKRAYKCPHDTMCLHRAKPKLGPIPNPYVDKK